MNINTCTSCNKVALSTLATGTVFATESGKHFMVINSATLDAKFRHSKTVNLSNGDVAIQKPTTLVTPLFDAVLEPNA